MVVIGKWLGQLVRGQLVRDQWVLVEIKKMMWCSVVDYILEKKIVKVRAETPLWSFLREHHVSQNQSLCGSV